MTSTIPMVMPPTTAPGGESRPPRMTAGKARSATLPRDGFTELGKPARNRPPTAATPPAHAHAPPRRHLQRVDASPRHADRHRRLLVRGRRAHREAVAREAVEGEVQ